MDNHKLATDLRTIVARASFIGERAAPIFEPDLSDEKTITTRLDAWAKAVDEEGQREVLQRVWDWDGVTAETARRMVAPVTLRADAPLPEWAELLGQVLTTPIENDSLPFFQKDAPIAFQEILLPFLLVFERAMQTSPGWQRLSANAQTQVTRNLLMTLSHRSGESLYLQFNAFRNRQPFGPLAVIAVQKGKPPGATMYQKFVAQMRDGGLRAMLNKYPVLARVLATLTLLRIRVFQEFLAQLDADADALSHTFNQGEAVGQVESITLGLSDAHRGGHGVFGLKFESGLQLIYKPKDLAAEAAYNDLLTWLNARGAPLELRPLIVLNRGEYGWVTFAEHAACEDEAALQRFYARVGMLLCLTYALEGTDCHYENLIACGEQPILIDHETLFHHRVPEEVTDEVRATAIFKALGKTGESVLRVGLLPGWRIGKDKKIVYDVSGLGAFGEQLVPFRSVRLKYANTDAMNMSLEHGQLKPEGNVPMLNGAPARLEEHVEQVVNGFRAMYDFLLAQRDALLAPDSPLQAFRRANVRFIFRATQVYGSLLKQAIQPAYLFDGAEYSLFLERIARAHVQIETKPSCYPMLASERIGLYQLDIPFFVARTDSADLQLDQLDAEAFQVEAIKNYFEGPSFERAVARLQSLSPEDCGWQAYLIQISLRARVAGQDRDQAPVVLPSADAPDSPVPTPADEPVSELFVTHALAIANKLRADVFLGDNGSATWLGPQYISEVKRYQLSALSYSFYDGTTGVGLFLAALARITGDDTWRNLSLAAFHSTREGLKKEFDDLFRLSGLGGTSGVTCPLYPLVRSGQWLGDESLIEDARAAAQKLTREQIQIDPILDIISGSAGAILGLLAVYEATGDIVALERAVDCEEHLLNSRVAAFTGHRVWKGIASQPLTGFSHGAAGGAYALQRLAQASGRAEFDAAAEEALAYENALFDPAYNNWPDLRNSVDGTSADLAQPEFMNGWCHGAAGIGMSRLGNLALADTPTIRRDIEAALTVARRSLAKSEQLADHLCCGNLGRVELFATAGQALRKPELIEEARGYAAQIIAHAEQDGGFHYAAFLPRGIFSPGFFQGGSGIGYELLRLAYPEKLPNVLLWQ
ncbi:MAG: type 2 lantipeptide synthetase LanM family protein [Anaerolineae bacterium]|nr:type 2 lantipeptide synthetase LanM family protein [Anaerolineae bacterium]